mmetsp:Transcript_37655/g.84948  ORF Transcript_37655/g.84948 Transcript_37655/m.84948 type:complete len:162 (-) Transcript_37655:20-505(-)
MFSPLRIAALVLGLALVQPVAAAGSWWDWLWPFGGSHSSDAARRADNELASPALGNASRPLVFDAASPGSESVPVTGTVVDVKLDSELQLQATLLQEGLEKGRLRDAGLHRSAVSAHAKSGELRGARPKKQLPMQLAAEPPAHVTKSSGPAAVVGSPLEPL